MVVDPRENEQILDLAAAPGGKAIQMAIVTGDTCHLVANDLSHARVSRMKRLVAKYGLESIKTTTIPGQRLWMKHQDYFDKVLLDAPCTMTGTDTPSDDTPQKLAKTQKWLLRSAISACRPGGTITYSTCTTSRAENEDVVDWAIAKDKDKVSIEPITIPTKADSELYPQITTERGMVRVIRGGIFEGFFIAKLRRKI